MGKKRLLETFKEQGRLLSVYYTAGYPSKDDTANIARYLQEAGADLIEIGIPFSDPVADGPTIQSSNKVALDNGMTLQLLLDQIRDIKEKVKIPIILMGYLNPVLQYGVERFCAECNKIGIDGLILPDLPLAEFEREYKQLFGQYDLSNIFLVTPQTSFDRIRQIDLLSDTFIYVVSSSSITGAKQGISEEQITYLERIRDMELQHATLVGFGVSESETFSTISRYASGSIVGSAFIKMLSESVDLRGDIVNFVKSIKQGTKA